MTDIPSGRPYYVVVSERDSFQPDTGQPIVHEQGLLHASLDDAMERRSGLFDRYGRTWIARLEFIEEDTEVMTDHTPHRWAEAIKAWANGQPIQCRAPDKKWTDWIGSNVPAFDNSRLEWRPKPRMLSINGHEFPAPETEAPAVGTEYFMPEADAPGMANQVMWDGDGWDLLHLRRRLVHLAREAAVAHARAEILAVGGEV